MGMGMALFDYLAEKRLIKRGSRILDIGSQNLYNATPETVRSFVKQFGRIDDEAKFAKEAKRIAYFSTPRPGERTAFIAELLDLVDIEYLGYDVCPSPGTEIFDLNIQRLPEEKRSHFDIILNFGTTEHLINQLNAFEVMHEAMQVGGISYHQLPSVGWIDHGYFNYNGLFIDDLVKANDYEVVDKFFTTAGVSDFGALGVDVRDATKPLVPHSATAPAQVLNFNLNYLIRKTVDAPFHVGLEIATTHAPLSSEAEAVYGHKRRLAAGDVVRQQARGEHRVVRRTTRGVVRDVARQLRDQFRNR
jgi:hypothetical protein